MKSLAVALCLFAESLACASAGEFKVKEVRAYLFFSHTGQLSENIVGSKKDFFNTVIGEGQAGGAASHVLVDVVLVNEAGAAKNGSIALKAHWRAFGKDTSLSRAYDNSTFEAGEVRHEAVLLENATCAPVKIETFEGKAPAKAVTLKFTCGE